MILKRIQSYDPYKIVGIFFVLLFFIFIPLFMKVIFDLRIKELKIYLQNLDQEQDVGNSLSLIVRYNIVKSRQNSSLKNQQVSDLELSKEVDLLALQSESLNSKYLVLSNFRWLERPALFFTNAFSFLFGTKPIQNISKNIGNKLLEVGYYYEIKRNYEAACHVYKTASEYFSNKNQTDKLSYSELHVAFCLSFLGDIKLALEKYTYVIDITSSEELKQTAYTLRQFLLNLQKKRQLITSMSDNVNKGELLYVMANYKESINLLTNIQKKGHSKLSASDRGRLHYFKGRSYEELGKVDEAVKEYKKAIQLASSSRWAKKANQRIYINGSLYTDQEHLRNEAYETAKKVNDIDFFQKAEKVQKTVEVLRKNKTYKLSGDKYTQAVIKKVNVTTEANLDVPKREALVAYNIKSGILLKLDESKKERAERLKIEAEAKKEQLEIERKERVKIEKEQIIQLKKLEEDGNVAFKKTKYFLAINYYSRGKRIDPNYTNWNKLLKLAEKSRKKHLEEIKNQKKIEKQINQNLKEQTKQKSIALLLKIDKSTSLSKRREALSFLFDESQGKMHIIFLKNGNRLAGYILSSDELSITFASLEKTSVINKLSITAMLKLYDKNELFTNSSN